MFMPRGYGEPILGDVQFFMTPQGTIAIQPDRRTINAIL